LVLVSGFYVWSLESPVPYLDIADLIFTILWATWGWLAMRQENRSSSILFFCFSFIQPAYIIWKFIHYTNDASSLESSFKSLVYVMGGLSLLCRVFLIICGVIIYQSFGKGLKEAFEKEDQPEERIPILDGIETR